MYGQTWAGLFDIRLAGIIKSSNKLHSSTNANFYFHRMGGKGVGLGGDSSRAWYMSGTYIVVALRTESTVSDEVRCKIYKVCNKLKYEKRFGLAWIKCMLSICLTWNDNLHVAQQIIQSVWAWTVKISCTTQDPQGKFCRHIVIAIC